MPRLLVRLHRIFQRYADENMRMEGSAHQDERYGRIDRLRVERNRLIAEGWTRADRIGLRLERASAWTTPGLASPGSDLRGFSLDLPLTGGSPEIILRDGDNESIIQIPGFSAGRIAFARTALWPRYLLTLLGLVPHILRWKVRGDLAAREVIKEGLGLVPRSLAVEMDRTVVLSPKAEKPELPSRVTVIIPVYNAFDLLPEVLSRAEAGADLPIRMVLIEDCSTDSGVRPFLEQWAADPGRIWPVHLKLNAENLGFIQSVNRGFDTAREWPNDPVVLLNSDALLPAGWTSRLTGPLADRSVATVTPMSNDAEIFNIPVICRRGDLSPGSVDRIDASAQDLNPRAGWIEAPTGVGFCMALSPAFLARLPGFDTIFGRGYGEETDWCQKARALGGRHVAAVNLFVEHRGGTSFGSEAKRQLLERNGAEISRRYPAYDREVQDFIRSDPLATARLALALSWAAEVRSDPVPVWVAHAMGGGAENDLKRRIADEIGTNGPVVVLRIGQGHRWKLELHTALGLTQGLTNDLDLIRSLLSRLPRRRIIYSCGVGDRDPIVLPGLLLELAGQGEVPLPGGIQPIEVLVHDFFPVSPSYTLLGKDGLWHGIPVSGTIAGADPAHRAERPGGAPVTLEQWQAAWGKLVAGAERITTFSESSAAIIAQVWPDSKSRIVVIPHRLLADIPLIPPSQDMKGRPVIGILGNIGLHKGAAIVQQLAQDLVSNPVMGLVVIGQFDPAFKLPASATVHGSYELRDLPGLVERYGISAWLIPSVWPETFSFTTHEAIATGMPVFAFDLGAQGDALRAALERGATGALLPLTGRINPEHLHKKVVS